MRKVETDGFQGANGDERREIPSLSCRSRGEGGRPDRTRAHSKVVLHRRRSSAAQSAGLRFVDKMLFYTNREHSHLPRTNCEGS